MTLGFYIYSTALLAQLLAALYALNLYRDAKSHHVAAGCFAFGLALMMGRRIYPMYGYLHGEHINLIDAWLSLAISFSLLMGVFHIKQVWGNLESRNFLLNQNLKEDSLTGALSRTETFSRSQLEIERSLRAKDSLSFLMLDIDLFKNINDQYGHPFGDSVLKNLSKVCQAELRAIDIFGRVGGEEFWIVLPHTDINNAQEVAERLRVHISNKPCGKAFTQLHGKSESVEVKITVSIGVATFDPIKDREKQAWVILKKYYDLSDKAMYRAKQAGRNRISP